MENTVRLHKWQVVTIALVLIFLIIGITLFVRNEPYRIAEELIEAIKEENTVHIQEMLESGVDPNQTNIKPSELWSLIETSAVRPLAVACKTGNLEITSLLMDYGATAEYIENTGWSPLRETLFRYHTDDVEIVKLLLLHGADPFIEEADVAAVFAAADMVPMPNGSEEYLSGYDPATAEAITQIVEMLLDGGSVDMQTAYGRTLLMYAAERGNLRLAEYLIAQGCDVTLVDYQGKTALDYAVDANKQDMVELLNLSAGA